MNKKIILSAVIACICSMTSFAQSTERKFTLKNLTSNESELTVYLPKSDAAAKANGRAIVDCPGGGYSHLSMENEGHDWAEFYNEQGIAYVVLKYRMPNGDRNIPLNDAYQAIRTVRDSCKVWNINPMNVGIQGFSAGGHLASAVSTHAPMDARPDFSILFYPVISMNEKETHAGSCKGFLGDLRSDESIVKEWSSNQAVRRHLTPPAILILANDDRAVPPATNAAAYYTAMRKNGNQCSMFCYPSGGHGFGFRSTWRYHEQMKTELRQWLKDLVMPKATAKRVACIGNSITDGSGIDMSEIFGYPAQLGRVLGKTYNVKNFGLSGRTMSNSADRPYMNEPAWKACLEWQPDVVVIKLGTNDTKSKNWEGKAEKDFTACMQQMVDALKALPTHPRIILCAPVPSKTNRYDIRDSVTVNCVIPMIKAYAKKAGVEYLDLYNNFGDMQQLMQSDMVHPNDKGAVRMAELVAEHIRPVTIDVIGDSYVANHLAPKEDAWHCKMAEAMNMTYNNYGKNGACIAFDRSHDGKWNFGPAMYTKTKMMDPKADYVLIIGGHNDADKIGTNKDSLQMFTDSLSLLIKNIKLQCPKAKIGFVTPWYVDRPGFAEVCGVIQKVCKKNKIPVLMNYSPDCVIKVRDDDFRKKYFQSAKDTAHLNAKGHDLFLPIATEWFNKYMKVK